MEDEMGMIPNTFRNFRRARNVSQLKEKTFMEIIFSNKIKANSPCA